MRNECSAGGRRQEAAVGWLNLASSSTNSSRRRNADMRIQVEMEEVGNSAFVP
jgi:hypothetical protein